MIRRYPWLLGLAWTAVVAASLACNGGDEAPAAPEHRIALGAAHALLWLAGAAGIGLFARRLGAAAHREQAAAEEIRATLYGIGDGVIATDATGRITRMNPVAESLTGWREAEALGRPLEEVFRIVNEETRLPVESPVARVLREGTVVGLANHTSLIARDGTERPIADSGAPVRTADGALAGVVLVFRDQSAERAAEQALRKSEERFRLLFAHMQEGLALHEVICDEAGTPVDYRFLEVNPAFERLTGLEAARILGKTVLEVLPQTEARWIEAYGRVALTGEPAHFQDYSRELDRHYEVTAYSPKRGQFSVVFFDVTERKRAEAKRQALQAQLLQAQKMEAVGRLAGGVAHDFNNMLQVILGYADLALAQVQERGATVEYLRHIEKAAQHATDLTRQILAFARRQAVAPRVLDLNGVVEGLLKMLRLLIGEDVALRWEPARAPATTRMDPSQVSQVLANLVINARDAIGNTGTITIETGHAELEGACCARHPDARPGPYVFLAVSDTGCGMDEETRAHLFEPFFTTKPTGQGTGLGLATVYGIVTQNEGFVTVYSEPGQGTSVKIYLPRHDAPAEPADPRPQAQDLPRGSETILLVEDEPALLELGTQILEKLGYTVLACSSPHRALEVAESGARIDLLLTDVVMPGMNGRELYDRLAPQRPGLRCLFISGYTANAIADRGIPEEGAHFLEKPFSAASLAAKVREVLAG